MTKPKENTMDKTVLEIEDISFVEYSYFINEFNEQNELEINQKVQDLINGW